MASLELFSCDFPVYSVSSLREGEFYLAGGGGKAKTGVPNALVSQGYIYNASIKSKVCVVFSRTSTCRVPLISKSLVCFHYLLVCVNNKTVGRQQMGNSLS